MDGDYVEQSLPAFAAEGVGMLSVSQLTQHIRDVIDADPVLGDIAVRGEISGFRQYPSGHLYFSLKDATSQIPCVMFAEAAQYLRFRPEDGTQVVAQGRVTVYVRRGAYQLVVVRMRPAGLGPMYEALERLKRQLAEEGLFAPERKRRLPLFPRCVGIVTSEKGAAVRDMIHILGRRFPAAKVLLFQTQVQGAEAAPQIVQAIALANRMPGVDVLIVGRGGGSPEDLWAFNEEVVVRAIAASRVPVVSAVGHETDVTLSDFAADLRAPTPSAAAEMVVPDAATVLESLVQLGRGLGIHLRRLAVRAKETLEAVGLARLSRSMEAVVEDYLQYSDELSRGIRLRFVHLVELAQASFVAEQERLRAMSPYATLERGYCVFQRAANRALIGRVNQVRPGEETWVIMRDGRADCLVQETVVGDPATLAGEVAAQSSVSRR